MGEVVQLSFQENMVGLDHFKDQKAKDWLIDLLQTREVEITFIKRDDTERIMDCSLDPVFIPVVKKKTERIRKENPDVLSVVDVEIGEWRSIRWDSITNIKWGVATND